MPEAVSPNEKKRPVSRRTTLGGRPFYLLRKKFHEQELLCTCSSKLSITPELKPNLQFCVFAERHQASLFFDEISLLQQDLRTLELAFISAWKFRTHAL